MVRTIVCAMMVVVLAGCAEKTPTRDHIPLLRQKIYDLQQAVKSGNPATVDSLLSVRIISHGQSSDSLLKFIYGAGGDFEFERFGNYDITYTNDKARIDCFVMDSASLTDRPITLFLAYEHDMWLLTSFEAGKPELDSLR